MAKDENTIILPIQENPFYKHYQYGINTPNSFIVKQRLIKSIKKRQLKSKILYKKSAFPYSQDKTKILANAWLSKNFNATIDEGNWTKNLKRTTLKNTIDAYCFDYLRQECDSAISNSRAAGEVNEGESTNYPLKESEELTNVNELTGYMENILYIPKNMSQQAEMMYL